MCWEKLTDEFTTAETRVVDTKREEDLERPETWREPVEEAEEGRDREKELVHF